MKRTAHLSIGALLTLFLVVGCGDDDGGGSTSSFTAVTSSFDFTELEGASSESCALCHQRIFDEWKSSSMGTDLDNKRVFEFFTGTNGAGELDGLGFQGLNPGEAGDCADCHVPVSAIKAAVNGGEADLGEIIEAKSDHGISCIFCHSISAVNVEKDQEGRYHTRILDTTALGPENLRYGPLADADAPTHETAASDLFRQSEICAICHLNQERFLSISTYDDWKEAFDAGKVTQTCQECHMPLIPGEVEVGLGGPLRSGMRAHTFTGVHDPELLANALSLDVTTEIQDGTLVVRTTVENTGTGHRVPGSAPISNVILKIDVVDANDEPLTFTGGDTALLPPLAGAGNPTTGVKDAQDWAGMPGKMYAKVYQSALIPQLGRKMVGVGGFAADTILFDTTLAPLASDQMEFAFALPAAGTVTVKAKLVFRNAFKPLVDAKGWTLEDLPMQVVEKEIPEIQL